MVSPLDDFFDFFLDLLLGGSTGGGGGASLEAAWHACVVD